MKNFEWSQEKNEKLKEKRGISFEDIKDAIENQKMLDKVKNKNYDKYPNQKVFIVEINNYAYLVPFVENAKTVFLKTIFPSRKATKKYLK